MLDQESSNNSDVSSLDEYEILESFIDDNPDLERLEAILDDFNPFVALSWVRQEIRHSAFLRWLLDPSETHGLNDYILQKLLKRISQRSVDNYDAAPTIFDVESWDLRKAEVLAEWQNVDLLIVSDTDKFVVAIENKVDSSEHSDQLQRYKKLVEKRFPEYKRMFVYLTVDGEVPSDDAYAVLNYQELADLVALCINRRADQINPDVLSFIGHYIEMVRRNIVENSEIQEICRQIYSKHKRALDIIFEHRPDRAIEVMDLLMDAIAGRDELISEHSSKSAIRFFPQDLEFIPANGSGEWTKTNRLVLFEIENYNSKVTLKLILGPGEEEIRNRVHSLASKNTSVFNKGKQKLYPKWWTFHSEAWINRKQYDNLALEELNDLINRRFDELVFKKLPAMVAALSDLGTEMP